MKIINALGYIMRFIIITLSIILLGLIIYLGVLPLKYFILVLLGIGVLDYLLSKFMTENGYGLIKIIPIIISIVFTIFISILIINMFKTAITIFKIHDNNVMSDKYYIVTLKDSPFKKESDIFNFDLGVYNDNSPIYRNAIAKMTKQVYFNDIEYASIELLKYALYDEKVDGILLNSFTKEYMESTYSDFVNKTNVIFTTDVEAEESVETNEIDVTKNVFNIYISGIDTYGSISNVSRSDVNMIATVNLNTSEILFTSIPRDYYVKLHDVNNLNDKLTHASIYGVNMSVATIEDLLGININYYLRVNFTSLMNVVDLIGGIDVYSDLTFTPYTNSGIRIKEGYNHMNGAMALAFARERYAYKEGDLHRVRNEQDVLIAIIKKITSNKSTITKYTSLLDEVSKSIETNMKRVDIGSIVKLILNKTPNFKIGTYSLTGTGDYAYTYSMGSQKLYVMIPDEETVRIGANNIINMQSGISLSELDI